MHYTYKNSHDVLGYLKRHQASMAAKRRNKVLSVFLIIAIISSSLVSSAKIFNPSRAKADYQYTATGGQINSSKGTQRYNNFEQTRAADGSIWTVSPVDITGTDTSLDMETTIGNVQQQGANKMILTFRVSSSSTTLHYVFSVYDNSAGVWRPLNNHTLFNPSDAGNNANFYSREITPAATNTLYTYQFEIFNGYFADTTTAPGTAIDTPIGNFISSNNVKLRVSSNDDCNTATWFMNWDLAYLEVAIDPGYAPSSVSKTTGGSFSRYYSDTFTSDNAEAGTTNTYALTLPSSGNAVNFDFTFNDIEPPYAGANTILLWYEGATSVANLTSMKIYFWNYTSSTWEATAVSSGNASSTTINANRILMFSTPLTDHISASGSPREAKIKIEASHSASFNVYVDWLKLVIGSTNDGSQQNNVSVGSTSSGTVAAAADVDTTAASPNIWTIASSNTYTNQFSGDTNSTYSVAEDHSVPITEPSGGVITGMHQAARVNSSSATPVLALGLRDYSGGWSDFHSRAASTSYSQTPLLVSGNNYRYQVWGSFGSATSANAATDTLYGRNPRDHIETASNLAGFKIRTTTGQTSTFNVLVDFVFQSIRYVTPTSGASFRIQYTSDDGTVNTGTSSAGSWRFTKQADGTATPWTITNSGSGVGVDVQLEFQGVTLPTTYNRLIVNSKYAWSTASSTHNMQIYDFTNSVWRPLGGHAQAVTDYNTISSTAGTYQFYQYEIFDGYFRNTDAAPGTAISTPVANFVGTGADAGKVRIKYVRGTTTSNLSIDWAQIEIAQDPAYYSRSAQNVVGTSPARFYNDLHYPDNTINSATYSNSYSYAVTKATSGTDRIDTRFTFEGISAPYEGANAIFVDTSWAESVVNEPINLQIYNFTSSSWQSLNSGNAQNATVSRYLRHSYIRQVSNWPDYINPSSPNDIRIRFYTTDTTALTLYIDYLRITLGSVTSASESANVTWGTSYLNDKTATANMDTSQTPTMSANTGNAWYISPYGAGRRTYDGLAGAAANINFPVTRPNNTQITGIRWAIYTQSATTLTLRAKIRETAQDYTDLINSQYLNWSGSTGTNPGLAPTAADAYTVAAASQTYISGLYQNNEVDAVDSQNNKINIALNTSASTSLIEQNILWDLAFVSIRYVGL